MSKTPKIHPLTAAQFYLACGYSVIPIVLDGTKKPALRWEGYATTRPTPAEIHRWFEKGTRGLALIQGSVSAPEGHTAELLEFETREVFDRWERGMHSAGHEDLADLLSLRVVSGGGGVHVYFRHTDEPQGNQKLARSATPIPGHKQGADGLTTLIETRGMGGYVVAPGSPPEVHETRNPYRILSGSFKTVPVLTPGERQAVFGVCRELDERPTPKPKTDRPTDRPIQVRSEDGGRPGDDFNERGALDALACLERHGWTIDRDHGDWQELCRPGKTRGGSATFGFVAPGVLHVFSSNAAPFELDATCGPFEIVTRLDFGGDFAACARFLGNRGYGTPLPARSLDRLNAKPAHRTPPGESGDEATPEPAPQERERGIQEARWMYKRLIAAMRLEELGKITWPTITPSDPDDQSEENGELIAWVGTPWRQEVAIPRALVHQMRHATLSETIRIYESALETDNAVSAYEQLWQIDHLLDHAGVYVEFHECVAHYLGEPFAPESRA